MKTEEMNEEAATAIKASNDKVRIDLFAAKDNELTKAISPDEPGFLEQFGKCKIEFRTSTTKDGRVFYTMTCFLRRGQFSFNLVRRVKGKNTPLNSADFLHYQMQNQVRLIDGAGYKMLAHGFRVSRIHYVDTDTGETKSMHLLEVIVNSYKVNDAEGNELTKFEILSSPLTSSHRKLFNDLANLSPEQNGMYGKGIEHYILPIYNKTQVEQVDHTAIDGEELDNEDY